MPNAQQAKMKAKPVRKYKYQAPELEINPSIHCYPVDEVRNFKNDIICTIRRTTLKPEYLKKQAQRLKWLQNKVRICAKILPDIVHDKAFTHYTKEIKFIKSLLQYPVQSVHLIFTKKGYKSHKEYVEDATPVVLFHYYRAYLALVRNQRVNRKQIPEIRQRCGEWILVYKGEKGIHSEPGQFREIYLRKREKDIFKEKKPVEKIRYVGVEIEFCAPMNIQELAHKFVVADLNKFVHVKTDGSLRPREKEVAFEIAALVPEKDTRLVLKKICDILKEVKAETEGRRCGLHVHFDMRHRDKDLVYHNLVSCQEVLWKFLEPDRRDNEFCRPVYQKRFPRKFTGSREERYHSINAAAYYRHKTLEVRMHQGTVDFIEISNWLNILIKIVNSKKRIKGNVREITQFNKKFKFTKGLVAYMEEKQNGYILQSPRRTVEQAQNEILARLRDDVFISRPRRGSSPTQSMVPPNVNVVPTNIQTEYAVSPQWGASSPATDSITYTLTTDGTNLAVNSENGNISINMPDEESENV